jgi:small ligand-binding sensory domain FIST
MRVDRGVAVAGSGLAVGLPPADAALEASLAALAGAGADHADLALVFATGDAYPHAHAMLYAVRRVTGARAVVGCSGGGVLTERREVEDEPAVAVLAVADPRLVVTPFLVEALADADAAGAEALARQTGAGVAEGGCLLVLPDTEGLDPRALLAGLDEHIGGLPVVGGVAAGAPLFELYGTDARRGALAGAALSGPRPIIGVAQGCAPIGEPFVVTRAERNVALEIGSRPALDVLREAVASVPEGAERVARSGLFAGLAIDPSKSPLERGDFLVRNVLGADPASGAVAVGETLRAGQTIQFQVRDAEASHDDLTATLEDVARHLDGRAPAFGVYFNCAGRGRGLFGVADHDVGLIRDRLGDFPLAGFFGNGEFAPVGRRNFFHTYTGVLVVFPSA